MSRAPLKIMRRISLPALLLTVVPLLLSHPVHSQALLYAVPDVNWEPYWIIEETHGNGILGKLMQNLATREELALKAATPFPVKRMQMLFTNGDIAVECCMNRNWRPAEDSAGLSLWTEPVLTTHEVLVFPKGKEFDAGSTVDLAGKRVATILGYGYANDDLYTRQDVRNNIAQLKLVAFNRVDVGIFDLNELRYVLKSVPEAQDLANKITLGSKIGSSDLRMRIHSTHPELLEKLNKHIKRVKSDGTLEQIRMQYLGPAG